MLTHVCAQAGERLEREAIASCPASCERPCPPPPAVAEHSPAYLNGTIFARAPWPGWKHARLVIGEECLHCGRAIDPAAEWRVAIAIVGPDDQPGPERPLGALHAACIAFYLDAQTPGTGDD